MQLIALAMPKGDKEKQKNRNRRQSRSNDGSADNQNRMVSQDPEDGCSHEKGNTLQAMNLPLPPFINIEDQNVCPVDACSVEEVRHLSIAPSEIGSDAQQCSASTCDLLPITQRGSVTEDVLSAPHHQDNVSEDSSSEVAAAGNKWKFTRANEMNSHCSRSDISKEGVGSGNAGEQGISSHPSTTRTELLSVKSESIESDRDTQEVDENMNLTCKRSDYLTFTRSMSSVQWSKSVLYNHMLNNLQSSSGTSKMSNTDREDTWNEYASSNDPGSVEQLFTTDTQTCRESETEGDISRQHFLPQKSISVDFADCSSNDVLHQAEVQTQETRPVVCQLNYFNLTTLFEPPLWTSLAQRENITNYSEMVRVSRQGIPDQIDASHLTTQMLTFLAVADNECLGHADETESEVSARCDTAGECDIPDHYVFQTCALSDAANISNHFAYGDNNVQSEVNNGEDEECDSQSRHSHVSVVLGDLDEILRLLLSTQIDRDMILNQMADEEVTMVMYHQEENGEDEELVSYDMVEDYIHVLRPVNPVACTLEHGGNEHFLPITFETSDETNCYDQDE